MIELQEKKRRVQALLDSLAEGRSQVERLQERISRLKALSTAVTPVYGREGGQRGRPSRGKSEVVDQLCDETERLGVQILRLLAVERQVEAWIDLLPKDGWRMVMRYRHLDGLGYPEILERMNHDTKRTYSDTTIFRLHREALEAAARFWPLD